MPNLLGSAASAAAAHWKRYTAVALVVVVVLGGLFAVTAGSFDETVSVPGTNSQSAYDLLSERFPQASGDSATIVFAARDGKVAEGEARTAIADALSAVKGQPHVVAVSSPLTAAGAAQVARDGRVAFADVQYDKPASELGRAPTERLQGATEGVEEAGVEVSYRGPVVDLAEQPAVVSPAELIGVGVAVLVLTLVLGSAVGMGVVLLVSVVSLSTALGLILTAASLTAIPAIAMTLALMMGLGVGIDYALLIAARHRESLAEDPDVVRAASRANRTAGTAVVAAAAIVIVAILGLLLIGIPFIGKMGLATGVAVAIVALGAVMLLPLGLGAAGRRMVPKTRAQIAPPALFVRWIEGVVRKPLVPAVAAVAVLLTLAAPSLGLRLGTPDDGVRAAESTQRVAYDHLSQSFGPGLNGPLLVSADLKGDRARGKDTIARIQRAATADRGVAAVTPAQYNERGDVAVLGIVPTTAPQAQETSELITRLREQAVPEALGDAKATVFIGGLTATNDDMSERIGQRLPLFIGLVVILAILLLMAAFRSVRVPLVSAAFNLLSVFAAYGLVVLVFQEGIGSELLGIDQKVPIVSFLPLFLFALLFGLSMDYNVFQQSRIREEHLRGKDARAAVVAGVTGTGKVIAAAGAIMVSVFASFMLAEDVTIKMIAFGLAAAILIDVTIIRFLLAPAVMSLLGDKAWRLPRWLDRLLPSISLEGDDRPKDRKPMTGPRPAGVAGPTAQAG